MRRDPDLIFKGFGSNVHGVNAFDMQKGDFEYNFALIRKQAKPA